MKRAYLTERAARLFDRGVVPPPQPPVVVCIQHLDGLLNRYQRKVSWNMGI